ncbi:hypothetical protein HDU83_009799 [Entophlyctis luteolus]|nr:hypothetical protein HDU83_009799 [Entophlyctis luteolus]
MLRAPPATPAAVNSATPADWRRSPDADADAQSTAMHCDIEVRSAALAIVALSRGGGDWGTQACFAIPPPPPPVSAPEPLHESKAEPDPTAALSASVVVPRVSDRSAAAAGPRVVACDACRRSRKKCVFPTRRTPVPDIDNRGSDGGCLSCVRRGVLCSAVVVRRKTRSRSSILPQAQSSLAPVKPAPPPTTAAADASDEASPQFTSAHPHRIPVSCKSCYSKKMRCDRGRPGCSACAKRGVQCSYWSHQQLPSSPSPPASSPIASRGASASPSSSIFSVKIAPSTSSTFSPQTATPIPSVTTSSHDYKDSTLYSNPPVMLEDLDSVSEGFWP